MSCVRRDQDVIRCPINRKLLLFFFFFFNDTATTEIYTLSLHDALPILCWWTTGRPSACSCFAMICPWWKRDRKSTRLNSSHLVISYAVFCLKKKKQRTRRADAWRALLTHPLPPPRAHADLPHVPVHIIR